MNYLDSPYIQRVFDLGLLHLELNTFLFVLMLVLVAMFFLNALLFRPVLRTLEAREKVRKSLEVAMNSGKEEISRLQETYEKDLARLREDVAQVRSASHKEAQKAVEKILEAAREESKKEYSQAHEALSKQIAEARKGLDTVAKNLAERTIGRMLSA